MNNVTLTKTRIQAGTYEAVLTADADGNYHPDLLALHLERELDGLTVTADESLTNTWHVRFEIPREVLTDGVQTFLITEKSSDATLDSFTILTGEVLSDDIRAEMDLLRAELDMLKKAFRRHCVETN
ncbi:hypothetical protein [Litoreibacter arenae]|uniref:Uncharacterized protein n=1 Tax=Litoreibacter arenae DSM 19593 TaxID=1123360 RepID=S9RUS0_9RHOB|nr:hypothetical protein [Litoreibacter arenae]EPX77674.1 hypothetical protein thalar_03399 [Litoreibacter arenae DSM 19593]